MQSDPDNWFQDRISPNLIQLHRLNKVIYEGRTGYQSVRIVETAGFGVCLVLDGKIQSSEVDEFIYHEALVQPPMIAHPRPQTVFIAGGGEGATLREVLRHQTVERAVMVDIDEQVTALCRQYLPAHSQGAFEDKRTELHHADAREFLAGSRDKYDVIIIDLPDPLEEGPAYLLYTQEFYRIAREKLNADGMMSVQSGSSTITELFNFSCVLSTIKSVFPAVFPFQTYVPSFGNPWGFTLASVSPALAPPAPQEIDGRIRARASRDLRFYDGIAHQGMFSLPKHLRTALGQQTRLITDAEPIFIHKPG
ncbi:MAG: polyamine aminopropyltransferase [Chloroflexi bacterium]|nr:polyamine aminopropyltransferase [Chloroflexota bacterium]